MPRLRPFSAKVVLRKLKKVGFQKMHQRGSHMYLAHSDGRIVTVPIHGSKDIPIGTMHAIVVH